MEDKLAKVRAEIESRLKRLTDGCVGQRYAYRTLLEFIDSLPEEPVSDDFKASLEKKVREAQDWTYIEEEGGECPLNEEFGADELEEFAKWGAEWQKEQMMSKAVDATIEEPEPLLWRVLGELEGLFVVENNLHDGDGVKVIIIKED